MEWIAMESIRLEWSIIAEWVDGVRMAWYGTQRNDIELAVLECDRAGIDCNRNIYHPRPIHSNPVQYASPSFPFQSNAFQFIPIHVPQINSKAWWMAAISISFSSG